MHWNYLIDGPWIVFAVYWTIGALKTRRTAKKESFAARYGVMALEVVGFYFLLSGDAAVGVLGRRVVSRTFELRVAGVVLLWAGIALALWARWHLGQYWSGRITIKEGHKLIRTGPYARLRHPIYSGLVLAAAGTAIEIDQWRGVAAVCIIVFGFWIKGRREEALLTKEFGAEFDDHRRSTGFLLPKLRSNQGTATNC
jgi:protein-S-isoprenylcysteine O-methyltransferase Ste14